MIKNIIFDLDGTIINDMHIHVYAWKKALKKFGIDVKDKELYLIEGASNTQFLDKILDKYNIKLLNKTKKEIHDLKICLFKQIENKKVSENKFSNFMFRIKLIFIGKIKPYNILNELEILKQNNIKMSVATGGPKRVAPFLVNKYFPNIFEFILTGDDVKESKPDPEQYIKSVKLLKAKKSETIVIENAPFGIISAKKAGLKVYAVATTLNKKYLLDADKVFPNHKKLFKYLFKELKIK
jgi:beta-phosphoglucomutase